jgi:hypothetical protein
MTYINNMEDNYNADRFIDELIESVYWYLPKEYRQYEFNELDREEKLKIAFENISLEKFRSMLDGYLEKVK